MRLRLVAVGTRMPAWVNAGVDEYLRRLPPELNAGLIEIPRRTHDRRVDPSRTAAAEGARILRVVGEDQLVALDERGRTLSTRQWAHALASWLREGTDTALVIGGPEGHSEDVLAHARIRWSLSALTLPHGLARVLVAEQLYRAWSIVVNHPYHRG